MTTNFCKNLFLGSSLTDEQMEDVPFPRTELHIHVMYKTIQAGSILGMCIIGPAVGLIRGRSLAAVKTMAMLGGRRGAAIGVVAGPVMTELALNAKKATPESVYDRSYRIRKNVGQVRTDRFATYGGIAGLGAASLMGAPVINGGIVGFTAATLFAGFYNNKIAGDAAPSKKEEKSQ